MTRRFLLTFLLALPAFAQEVYDPVDNVVIIIRDSDRGTDAANYKQGDIVDIVNGWNPSGLVVSGPADPVNGTSYTFLMDSVPIVGTFIRLGAEVMRVEQASSTPSGSYQQVTVTVARGHLGTTAVAHNVNDEVSVVRHPFLPPAAPFWLIRVWGVSKEQAAFLLQAEYNPDGSVSKKRSWQLRQQNVPANVKNFFLAKRFVGFGGADDVAYWSAVVTGDFELNWSTVRTWLYNKTTKQTA